jgi:hypothetical protein
MSDIDEAEAWLSAAESLQGQKHLGRARFTVIAALSIHSMIKANDALTMRFLRKRSTRHEDAPKLFRDLVAQNKIPSERAGLRDLLSDAVADKPDFDYKGEAESQSGAERRIRLARQFLDAVRGILR